MKEFLFVIKTLIKQFISFIIPIVIIIGIVFIGKKIIPDNVGEVMSDIFLCLLGIILVITAIVTVYTTIRDKIRTIREDYAWKKRNGHIE